MNSTHPLTPVYRATLRGIRAQIKEKGLSLKAVADATATTHPYLRNILTGRGVSAPVLERVAHFLATYEAPEDPAEPDVAA